MTSSFCIEGGGKHEQASSLVSLLIRALIPLDQGHTVMTSSNPNYFSKLPSPNTITLGIRPSTYEFRKNTGHRHLVLYSQSSRLPSIPAPGLLELKTRDSEIK